MGMSSSQRGRPKTTRGSEQGGLAVLARGVVYVLYTKQMYEAMPDKVEPEMLRVPLDRPVLDVMRGGVPPEYFFKKVR